MRVLSILLLLALLCTCAHAAASPTAARLKAMPVDTRVLVCDGFTDAEMELLGRFPKLEDLYFSQWEISEKGWQALSKLTQLKKLETGHGANVRAEDFGHIEKLSNLEVLIIDWYCQSNDESLERLANLKQLRKLSITNFQGTGEGLKHLAELEHLEDFAFKITYDLTDEFIASLTEFPALRKLTLAECMGLSDTAITHVAKLEHLTELSLDAWREVPTSFTSVNWNQWTTEGIAKLAALKRLRKLRLRGTRALNDDNCKQLASMQSLEELSIGFCRNVTDTGVAYLGSLPRLRVLQAYKLNGEEMLGRGFNAFSESPLQELDLSEGTSVDDAGMAAICAIPDLRVLDLTYTSNLEEETLRHLASATNLREFRYGMWEVSPVTLRAICKAQKLEVLAIPSTPLTDKSVNALGVLKNLLVLEMDALETTDTAYATLGRLTSLQELVLSYANLTQAGLTSLSSLNRLGTLHLTGGALAVSDFGPLAQLTELADLELAGLNKLDEASFKALSELPELSVLRLTCASEFDPEALLSLQTAKKLSDFYLGVYSKEQAEALKKVAKNLPLINVGVHDYS